MNTLALVIEERDQARAEVAYLRDTLMALTDPGFECPGEHAKFTASQRRVLCALKKAKGGMVRREVMLDALYFHRPDGPPDDRVVDVFVAKIRAKLRSHRIITTWGEGWQMVEIQNEVPV